MQTFYVDCSNCGTSCIIRVEADSIPEVCAFCGHSIDDIQEDDFSLIDIDEEVE